jgi:hypothetical protein
MNIVEKGYILNEIYKNLTLEYSDKYSLLTNQFVFCITLTLIEQFMY